MNFRFSHVVWGQAFTSRFLRACLPSQLSPGNLPRMAGLGEVTYRIYTTAADAETIRRAAAFRSLATLANVEFAEISGLAWVGRYHAMTQCHAHFLQCYSQNDDSLIMANPDWIWADGAMARLVELSSAGKRLVAITTPRVAAETFLPDYLRDFGDIGGRAALPRELVRLALRHLHPITRTRMWENTGLRSCAGELWWQIENEGLLARQFSLHPLMVRPRRGDPLPQRTIDADYIASLELVKDEMHVVIDSDDLLVLDFTSVDVRPEASPESNTIDEVVAWARSMTLARHREFVLHRVRFHAGDPSAAWDPVERRSDEVVTEILTRLSAVRADHASSPRPARGFNYWVNKLRTLGIHQLLVIGRQRVLARLGSMMGRPELKIRMTS